MFWNYLRITFRNIMRFKGYFLINISGLAIGLASCLLIARYILYEFSYDRFHPKAEWIYRVTRKYDLPNGYERHFARVPDTWINELPNEFPEIETLIRFQQEQNQTAALKIDETKIREENWFFTDSNIFEVFNFSLLCGDPSRVLEEPNSIVISQSAAIKYFGQSDLLGKEILLIGNTSDQQFTFRVTGIMQDIPANSHFHPTCLASWQNPNQRQGWAYVYILLKPGTDVHALQQKLDRMIEKYLGPQSVGQSQIILQKLTDIHLHSRLDRELEANSDIRYIVIFILVGVLLLVIAGFNFSNINRALATYRIKEIGIRKILGGTQAQLLRHFIFESVTIALIALLLGFFILEISTPLIDRFFGYEFRLSGKSAIQLITGFILLTILIGVSAGLHSGLFSSTRTLSVMFSGIAIGGGVLDFLSRRTKTSLQKTLVFSQFAISVALVITTLLVSAQFRYLMRKNLGFSTAQIIAFQNISPGMRPKYYTFKNQVMQLPGILDVTAVMDEPSKPTLDGGFVGYEGLGATPVKPSIYLLPCDKNFISFMEMKLLAGQDFNILTEVSPTIMSLNKIDEVVDYLNNAPRAYILNETAMHILGWHTPTAALGKQIDWSNELVNLQRGPVIGIVRNFNYSSLRDEIKPLILIYEPLWLFAYLVKVKPSEIQQSLRNLESTWETFFPNQPFEYQFLDELFARQYLQEKTQSRVLGVFTLLALFIANLGLFGLISLSTRQRTKEIGIRKVHGAATSQITSLFVMKYLKLLLLSNLIAWPLTYLLMKRWLQNYAYHIPVYWWIFPLAGGLAMLIALVTVAIQAYRAAQTNAVSSLHYE
jgi:putative ABC transport system permease protein